MSDPFGVRHTPAYPASIGLRNIPNPHTKGGTMAYTPELSDSASATLRRIAWAVGKPMTQTMNAIFMNLPNIIGKETICPSCRDTTRCDICGFGHNTKTERR
jgi:hypothetical protein